MVYKRLTFIIWVFVIMIASCSCINKNPKKVTVLSTKLKII